MAEQYGINPSVVSPNSISTGNNLSVSRDDINQSLKRSVIDNYPLHRYSSLTKYPLLQIFFFEHFAMLIFTYGFTCIHSPGQADIIITLSVFMAVSINAHLCGANLSPLITLSNCLRKQNKYTKKMMLVYLSAQIYGALMGLILGQLLNGAVPPPFTPEEHTFMGCFRVALSQMIGTFILVLFVLIISNPNTTFIQDQLSGYVFVSLFIHMGRKFAAKSGSCINFSVALAVDLMAASRGDYSGFAYLPLWLGGEVTGTVLAIVFYDYLLQPNIQYIRKKRRQSQNEQFRDLYENQTQRSGSISREDIPIPSLMKQEQVSQIKNLHKQQISDDQSQEDSYNKQKQS